MLTKTSKIVQKQIAEAEEKVGEVQNEFAKTFEEMSRAVVSRAIEEIERGIKLTQTLSAARSLPDVVSAYQEWLSAEMNARSEDARRFMTNSQKFVAASTRLFSNGRSGLSMS
jgi:hypothetical protein